MSHGVLLQLAGIMILGVSAQWVAWRTRLPSILILLVTGIIAGPVSGMLQPDIITGNLLLPVVSLSVAVILYEGGLNLKIRELHNIGGVLLLLTTVGVTISWVIGAVAAHYLLGFRWPVATLLGSILVVTGPTVIGPILQHLRLRGKVGALLKWEGIIIDPLGAMLAVLVFTVLQAGIIQVGIGDAAIDFGLTLVVGVAFGCAAAGIVILSLAKFWIPDFLHNPVSLMLMFGAFAASNVLREESGLLSVTVMGIVLANQKWVSIRHIIEFKETLRVLLIAFLFIILASQLRLDDLLDLGWESFAFVAVMMLVARPASVLASTWGSTLTWRERCLLSCMAPRGVVAAAIASVFALNLVAAGYPNAIKMVSVTFLLVFVTVLLYGLSATPIARRLRLIHVNPQGILFAGAHSWGRSLANTLKSEGCPVFLIDTDRENIRQARMEGLACFYGSALARQTREEIDFSGLSRILAITSNNEVNSLACLKYIEDFGRQEVYQLSFTPGKEGRHEIVSAEHRGRLLFHKELTFTKLSELMKCHPKVNKTRLTKEFDYQNFQAQNGDAVFLLCVMKPDGLLQICTVDGLITPKPGDLIFSINRRSCETPPTTQVCDSRQRR